MVKPCESSGRISASLSVTWSTLAMRGPWLSSLFNAPSWAALPMAYTSTRPSTRFFTCPAIPNRAAARSTKKRNPTPCTAPDTQNRLARVSTMACHAAISFLQPRDCSRGLSTSGGKLHASTEHSAAVIGSALRWNKSGFQEAGALAPTFSIAKPGASAPEASGLKSPSQNYLPVGAKAPTSYIANLRLLAKSL